MSNRGELCHAGSSHQLEGLLGYRGPRQAKERRWCILLSEFFVTDSGRVRWLAKNSHIRSLCLKITYNARQRCNPYRSQGHIKGGKIYRGVIGTPTRSVVEVIKFEPDPNDHARYIPKCIVSAPFIAQASRSRSRTCRFSPARGCCIGLENERGENCGWAGLERQRKASRFPYLIHIENRCKVAILKIRGINNLLITSRPGWL
jgi:hypothetical protein